MGNLIVYNNTLYYTDVYATTIGEIPSTTTDWSPLYSFIPQEKYAYNNNIYTNNIIYINNYYYLCNSNTNNSFLDNGINVYINNIYKNILINIYINDNTLPNISNTERDNLYSNLYSNLTTYNFSNAVNDIQDTYGFTNYVKYIILNENGNSIYDFGQINSYKNLTSLLTVEGPNQFTSRISSLIKTPINLSTSQVVPNFVLNNNIMSTTAQKNYFNNTHYGNTIDPITNDMSLVANYSGQENAIYNIFYRHSGYYDPIFINIDLFKKGLTSSPDNYIFDTTLTNFGVVTKIISKVNTTGNILKFNNKPNLKSIYPIIDEFGYTTHDFFIFKSSWDTSYFKEVLPAILNTNILQTNIIIPTPVIYKQISTSPNTQS